MHRSTGWATGRAAGWMVVAALAGCGAKPGPENCAPLVVEGAEYLLCAKPGSSPDLAKVAHELAIARTAEREAHAIADQAVKDAREVREKVDRVERDLQDLDAKVKTAVDTMVAAQNDADRAAASARLGELQREKAEMEARLAAAKAAAEQARRRIGMPVDPKCIENPLAKGCS